MFKFKDEIEAQCRVWIGNYPKPEKKFIILSHGRSGTGLLRSLINSHPDIYCDPEIFLHKKAIFPKRYIENRSRIFGKKIYGHKAKVFQLDRQFKDKRRVKETFLSEEYQIVYLRRRNFFRQAISSHIGSKRNKWHDQIKNPLAGKKFVINTQELIKTIEWIETCEIREKEILEGLDFFFISYEDDLLEKKTHQKTLDKVFDYLGVESVSVHTNYVKSTPEKLSDFIENYSEVIEAVKKSRYAAFLDE